MSDRLAVVKEKVPIHEEAIAGFCRRYHVRQLSLFGSVLREDFRPDSDVDVLVDFEPDHVPGYFRLADIEEELARVFDGRKIDLHTAEGLSPHIREHVLRSALIVFHSQASPSKIERKNRLRSMLRKPTTGERDHVRMLRMLDAARQALSFAHGASLHDIEDNRMLAVSLVHSIQVVGEAASRVSDETRDRYSLIPWQTVIGMRHRIVHEYDNINYDIVWEVVTEDLPELVTALEEMLGARPDQPQG